MNDTEYAIEEANYEEMLNMLTLEDRFGAEEENGKCLKLDGCRGRNHDWDCPKYEDYSDSKTGYAY